MRAVYLYVFLSLLVVGLAALPAPVMAAEQVSSSQLGAIKVGDEPLILLRHWQNAEIRERYSFLIGFITMLEMEKSWQGDKPLPLKSSLVNSWSKGFAELTIKQISDSLDEYIAANPKDLDRPLVEVMWFRFAQPHVKETIRPDVPTAAKPAKKAPAKKAG